MLINRFNFLMWGAPPPEPEHLTNLPEGGPNGRMSATVLLVPGEALNFFLNAPDGLTVSSNVIQLVDERNQVVNANVGSLQAIATPGLTNPQYTGYVTGPVGLKEGYYRLMISGGAFYSTRLWYKPSGYETISALFSFRNRRNLANFPYELPTLAPFRQIMRLKCYSGVSQADTKLSDYTNVFNAKKRTTSIDQHMFWQFTALDIDAIGREGYSTLFAHKDILVNGKPVSVKSGFTTNTDSPHLATGTFELWDSDFALISQC